MQNTLTARPVHTVSDERDITLSRPLDCILVSLISDLAKAEVAKAPRGVGLAAWWYLVKKFEQRDSHGFAGMLG